MLTGEAATERLGVSRETINKRASRTRVSADAMFRTRRSLGGADLQARRALRTVRAHAEDGLPAVPGDGVDRRDQAAVVERDDEAAILYGLATCSGGTAARKEHKQHATLRVGRTVSEPRTVRGFAVGLAQLQQYVFPGGYADRDPVEWFGGYVLAGRRLISSR